MNAIPIQDEWVQTTEIKVFEDHILVRPTLYQFAKLEQALEIVDCIRRLSDGIRYPILADIRQTGGASYCCYQTLAWGAMRYVSATALLVQTPFSRLVGNFYIHHHDLKKVPTRLFTKEEAALLWLLQHQKLDEKA